MSLLSTARAVARTAAGQPARTVTSVARLAPTPSQLVSAAGNATAKLRNEPLADLRPMPSEVIDAGPTRTVHHYTPREGDPAPSGLPVLLVPPLAAPALCFDLRRGCSYAEHLVSGGRHTYLLDYGQIAFSDRHLGVEHFVENVVPAAVEAVSEHTGGGPVLLVGWCLGGIFSLLTVADRPDLPVAGVTVIASPFDVAAVPMIAPLRPLVNLPLGVSEAVTASYRLAGGAPAPLVRRAFQLTTIDKTLTKPLAVALNLDDRDFLAQLEAVDRFTANMQAYPGRTFGQLYHHLFRANDLAEGGLALGGRRIELGDVRQPVLAIAGRDDTIAPVKAVRRLTKLLDGAADVAFKTVPGGHLGALTGRAARHTTWPMVDRFLDAHDAAG
jgi:polyhydroxyalkanoate synthase subunit PhaC